MRLLHLDPPVVMNIKKIRRLMRKYGLRCPIRQANPYRQMAKAMKTSHVAKNEINRQFRSIDRATDVLSFPMLTFAEGEEAEVNENDEIVLGDIIISLERAKEQAEEYGHSLKREIAFLTAHSMLHLLGYDHMEPEEEAEMFRRQKEILLQAGFPRE